MSDTTQFFFNVTTGKVEELANRGQSKDLLGPYPTRADAQAALATAKQRTDDWDDDDRRWREGDS